MQTRIDGRCAWEGISGQLGAALQRDMRAAGHGAQLAAVKTLQRAGSTPADPPPLPQHNGRRAAPPRPTLLVGDLAACRAAFQRLQQRVLELSLGQQACLDEPVTSSVDAWRDLVPRCRALRETLMSLRELSHFTRAVYECAADVCARAQDWPEALKALQQLVNLIYPALVLQQQQELEAEDMIQQQQQRAAAQPVGPPGFSTSNVAVAAGAVGAAARGGRSSAGPPAWDENEDGEGELMGGLGAAAALNDEVVAAALAQPQFRRWPEAAAALAIYFACVQQHSADRLDTLSTLWCLPQGVLMSREVQAALRLHSALGAGDFVALFRLRAAAPHLVQLVLGAAAQRAREAALVVLAAAYRKVAVAAVCRMLQLDDGTCQLLACLELLADRGHVAAQRALGALKQEEQPAAADLVFKG